MVLHLHFKLEWFLSTATSLSFTFTSCSTVWVVKSVRLWHAWMVETSNVYRILVSYLLESSYFNGQNREGNIMLKWIWIEKRCEINGTDSGLSSVTSVCVDNVQPQVLFRVNELIQPCVPPSVAECSKIKMTTSAIVKSHLKCKYPEET